MHVLQAHKLSLAAARNSHAMHPGVRIESVSGKGYGLIWRGRRNLRPGEVVGFYTGDLKVAPGTPDEQEYAVEAKSGHVLVAGPTDPIGYANEPSESEVANCRAFQLDGIQPSAFENAVPQYSPLSVVVMVACTTVSPGAELTWVYGRKFKRKYVTGRDCTFAPGRYFDLFVRQSWDALGRKLPARAVLDKTPAKAMGSRKSPRLHSNAPDPDASESEFSITDGQSDPGSSA